MADESQVNAQLWTGGAITTEADVQQMAASGVTADIDCRLEFDDKSLILEYNGLPPTPDTLKGHAVIAYLYAGVADDGVPKPVSWFQAAWEFAQPILASGGVVLAHCAAGVNRGPSMAFFLLRAHWHLSDASAYSELLAARPQVQVAYRESANAAISALNL